MISVDVYGKVQRVQEPGMMTSAIFNPANQPLDQRVTPERRISYLFRLWLNPIRQGQFSSLRHPFRDTPSPPGVAGACILDSFSTMAMSGAIPTFYKVFLLYIEPFFSFLGAFYAFCLPKTYLQLTDAASAPSLAVPLGTHVALRQLGNLYLLFTLNEALVLRATDDVRVWKALLIGLLIADFGHLFSVYPLGRDLFWDVARWSAMDWGNLAFVYCGAGIRIAFLSGVGFSTRRTEGSNPKTPRRRKAKRT